MTTIPNIASLDEATEELRCFAKEAIRNAAAEHGLLIKIGRGYGIDRNDYRRLIKKCQGPAKEPDSISTTIEQTGISSTRESPQDPQAIQAVQKLRESLRRTSQQRDGKVLPMNQRT
ncbi:hypothetical protein [uncultured Ruegeria sp.]|uniref:hypothetical protein n=1 Tax=uncultured Ruegeria sp. TaxID=259304 RepID=UPI0026354026|nr:hypothetical protein [uncultured Ruegeria sp.]